MSQTDTFYIRFRGRTSGPYSRDDLARMVKRGQVTRMHQVSMDQAEWRRGSDVSDWLGEDGEVLTRDTSSLAFQAPATEPEHESNASDTMQNEAGMDSQNEARWYLEVNQEQLGPLADSQVLSMLARGSINGSTLVWREGYSNWMSLDSTELPSEIRRPGGVNTRASSDRGNLFNKVYCQDCGELISANANACPHCGASRSNARYPDAGYESAHSKTKVAAALLAIFIGGWGVHKFYYGSWGWGLLYIIFCWTLIPLFLSVIEFIILLSMSDKEFDRKYNQQPPHAFKW